MTEDALNKIQYIAPNRVFSESVPNKDGIPEWLQLTPGGNRFAGRDGRVFRIKSPRALVRNFNNSGEDLRFDIDHGSESMFGGTRSFGWLVEMELRANREIWGRVEWTPTGASVVQNKDYRSVSPTFLVNPESVVKHLENKKFPMEVIGFSSIALTNRPNLPLRSLNTTQSEERMDIAKLLTALGLDEGADESKVLQTIESLRTTTETVPNLNDFVPRADYEVAQNKLGQAVALLEQQQKARHQEKVDLAINSAVATGKVAPASVDYHRSCCQSEEGLKNFERFISSQPAIVEPNTSVAPKEKQEPVEGSGLTEAQKHLIHMWNMKPETFHAERAELVKEGKLQG